MTSDFFSSLATLLDNTAIHLAQISSDMNKFAIEILNDPNFDPNEVPKLNNFNNEDLEISFLKNIFQEKVDNEEKNSQQISEPIIQSENETNQVLEVLPEQPPSIPQEIDLITKEENKIIETETQKDIEIEKEITQIESNSQNENENNKTSEMEIDKEQISLPSNDPPSNKKENKQLKTKQDSSEESDFYVSLPLTQSITPFPLSGIFDRPPPPPSWPSKKNKYYTIKIQMNEIPNSSSLIEDFEQYLRDEIKKYDDPLSRNSLKIIKKKSPIRMTCQELKDKIQMILN